jgi:glycine betaine/proline transport system substrate-binding protein
MYFTLDQLHEVIYMINVEGIPPEEAARQWVDENQDVVNTWIP